MKFRDSIERAIYAAAFVRGFEDAHQYGVTNWAREEAEKTGENVVGIWERGIAVQALESAEGIVQLYRKAKRCSR